MIILKALLLIVLFAVVFVVITAVSVAWKVKDLLNSVQGKKKRGSRADRPEQPTIRDTRPSDQASRKIFSKDEGEYVDFKE